MYCCIHVAIVGKGCSSVYRHVSCVVCSGPECRHHLLEPELKMMQPAACMLEAVARGSELACAAVVAAIVPLLVEQFHSQSMASDTTHHLLQ